MKKKKKNRQLLYTCYLMVERHVWWRKTQLGQTSSRWDRYEIDQACVRSAVVESFPGVTTQQNASVSAYELLRFVTSVVNGQGSARTPSYPVPSTHLPLHEWLAVPASSRWMERAVGYHWVRWRRRSQNHVHVSHNIVPHSQHVAFKTDETPHANVVVQLQLWPNRYDNETVCIGQKNRIRNELVLSALLHGYLITVIFVILIKGYLAHLLYLHLTRTHPIHLTHCLSLCFALTLVHFIYLCYLQTH